MIPAEVAIAISTLRTAGLTFEECKEISRKIGERRKALSTPPDKPLVETW